MQLVTYCIMKDGLQQTIEKVVFNNSFTSLNHIMNCLAIITFLGQLYPSQLYAVTKDRVIKQLISNVAHFSSTKMWSSTARLMQYMSYAVHFIDEEQKFQFFSLQTYFLPNVLTAPILADAMDSALEEWKLMYSKQVYN